MFATYRLTNGARFSKVGFTMREMIGVHEVKIEWRTLEKE
jgi:hypothetical protein